MKVREAMTEDLITIGANDTIQTAAKQMKEQDVGWLVALADGHAEGVLSDRDIVIGAIAADRAPGDTAVRDVLSTDLVTCRPDDPIEDAAELMMKNKIRRLLVVGDGSQPVGAISLGDLATHIENDELAGRVLETICAAP